MKQPLNEQFRRMQKLAGVLNENQTNKGKYSDWWAKANNELDLDFDDDIYYYTDSYDEPWQGAFANKVININASDYEDFKNKVEKLYNKYNPF